MSYSHSPWSGAPGLLSEHLEDAHRTPGCSFLNPDCILAASCSAWLPSQGSLPFRFLLLKQAADAWPSAEELSFPSSANIVPSAPAAGPPLPDHLGPNTALKSPLVFFPTDYFNHPLSEPLVLWNLALPPVLSPWAWPWAGSSGCRWGKEGSYDESGTFVAPLGSKVPLDPS